MADTSTTETSELPKLPESKYVLAVEGDRYSSDWITSQEGYTAEQMQDYARAALASQPVTQSVEPVRAALEGMQRFWGEYPEFVPAPQFHEQACEAVEAMNAALAAPQPSVSQEAGK